MPEECNNIIYDYIMLFECVTCFTNSIRTTLSTLVERRNNMAYPTVIKKASIRRPFLFYEREWKIGMVSSSFPTSCDRGRDTTNPYDRF